MMLIPCPVCGLRSEDEFTYGGDATRALLDDERAMTDEQWTTHLYLRRNPKGRHSEYWYHRHGCGHWLVVDRDTVTHHIGSASLALEVTN